MANTVRLKRSAVQGKAPVVGDLELGELAVNTYDGKLYTKKNDGSDAIVEIGGELSADDLSDVDTTTAAPTDGQALVWDNTAQKWEPGNIPSAFDDLTDKTITVCDETVYSLTGTDLDGGNGPIQYKTLTANTTFTSSMAEGESITLMLDDGASAYTATWPTMTWVGGSAPGLPTTGYAVIVLWVVNGTLYGSYTGDA